MSEEQVQTEVQEERTVGYNQIDFKTATPEEIEKRFSRLYSQVKGSQRELNQYRSVASEQSKLIEDLQKGVGMITNHLEEKSFKDGESKVKAELQAAYEAGDTKAIADATDRLVDLKANKKEAAQKKESKPKEKAETQINSMHQAAKEGLETGELSGEEFTQASAWLDEQDERGQPLRPWAVNADPNDPDPDYVKAVFVMQKVWAMPNLTIDQRLAEIDRRMGVSKSSGGQTVIGGRLTPKPKQSKVTLSPEMEKLATRTKFAGNGKSDAEHIEAYKQQMARVQSLRGAK